MPTHRPSPPTRNPATKPLKEKTPYIVMESGEYDKVLGFLFSGGDAKHERVNGRTYKKIIIDGVEYGYNSEKPLRKKLKTKLNEVAKTPDYKRFKVLHNATKGVLVRKALKKYAIKQKANITDEVSALKRYANSYSITNINLHGYRGLSYLKYQEPRLKENLKRLKSMKILIDVDVDFEHVENGDETTHTIRSRRYNIFNEEDLKKSIDNMASDIELLIENKQFDKSGYKIKKIRKIKIHFDKYDPTRAGHYLELPKVIATKKACINIKNDDDYCFKYCVYCRFYEIYKKDHPQRMYHYTKLAENDTFIKWNGVGFPASNEDIDTFETINDNTISVNVYTLDDNDKIRPDRITKIAKPFCHVNLLRLDFENKSHYVLIKEYSRLMGSQTNKHCNKLFHCIHCQKGFQQEKLLNAHVLKGCMANEVQAIEMPEEAEKMFFKNHYKKLRCPYVIYGDFECLTTKTDEGIKGTYQEHKPSGYMLNVVNSITNESKQYLYRGQDCMDKFCNDMNNIREEIFEKMNSPKPMIITKEQEEEFQKCKKCFICGGSFNNNKHKKKVRDHCHFTGLYRGCAHFKCNIDYCFKHFKIPIFFHNLKNYDAHLIVSHFDKLNTEKDEVSVIAQNSEKFISFELKQMIFKDSFSFLSSSLDKLVKLTKKEGEDKRENWHEHFANSKLNNYVKDEYDLDLLTDKGIYPYDYMDDFQHFNETELPSKEHFYSNLSEQDITDEEYERAQHIWKHFNIKNLGEYHDLYLKTDVLLLTDVFENFRTQCLKDYELDPAHYYTLPNFSWDAMLLKTGISLDLIYDEEVYKMVERGLRGGMCQVSHRKAEANNKYMEGLYDESKPSSYINYLDANNLYGLAMCQKLPYKDVRFYPNALTENDIKEWADTSTGYILDVDVEYPKELHDYHKDYPLAPEIMNVSADMLSHTQKQIYKTYHYNKAPKDEKTKKLILNVMDKQNYVVHIKMLQYDLKQGRKWLNRG